MIQDKRLNTIMRALLEADSFADALPLIKEEMLTIMDAELVTVYEKARNGREIISRFKTANDIKEIRVPISASSISGFVAMSKRVLCIDDVYDARYLKNIHPDLGFDTSYDQKTGFRTKSMICLPIKSGDTLLGVLQVINRVGGGSFSQEHLSTAMELAQVVGQKFKLDFQTTKTPFTLLIRRGKLTEEQLDNLKIAAAEGSKTITQLMVEQYGLTSYEIGQSLERYYQVPFVPFDASLQLPEAILKKLNMKFLRKQCWVPLQGDLNELTVLIDDPNDSSRILEIQTALGVRSLVLRVGLVEDILRFLSEEDIGDARLLGLDALKDRLDHEDEQPEELTDNKDALNENEATVIQLVNRLIYDAQRWGASDIHIEPGKGKQPGRVRMRIDGECRVVFEIPTSYMQPVVARIKIISGLDISERRKPQDGKVALRIGKRSLELRIATIPTVMGESVVLRVLSSGKPLPIDSLNLTKENETKLRETIVVPHGIFLVTGPTGSGKTTTLHAILGELNTPDRKIWTAEDPVEITQPGLQQVQVRSKIGLDFTTLLRSFLRADPDVILIGEMRDRETAHSALNASLTGHLVFSTLHTNSASETVVRLLEMGMDPINFADALLGVLAQRLVRTLCECKRSQAIDDKMLHQLINLYGETYFAELNLDATATSVYTTMKCQKCGFTGYRGRTGVHELLISTPEIIKLITSSATVAEIREMAMNQGMRTLVQDGIHKVIKGQTDLIQLRKIVQD